MKCSFTVTSSILFINNRTEADCSWEKGIVSKRLKLDSSECHANFGGNNEARTINLPQDYRRDFTVAEIWKEKKNIVIIGHEETSFVLYCTINAGTCNLFNNRTNSLILLQPGKCIFWAWLEYIQIINCSTANTHVRIRTTANFTLYSRYYKLYFKIIL